MTDAKKIPIFFQIKLFEERESRVKQFENKFRRT